MARNPRLDEAVSIFTELGWADATVGHSRPEEGGAGRAAHRGVGRGPVGQALDVDPYVEVDLVMLWLFAIRGGRL